MTHLFGDHIYYVMSPVWDSLFLYESVLKCSCSPSRCLILYFGSSLVVSTQRRYTKDVLTLVGLLCDRFQSARLSPPQGCVEPQPPSLPLYLLPQIRNWCSGLRHCPRLFPEAAAPSPKKGELAGILELKQTAPRNSWEERDSRLLVQPEVFSMVGNLLLKGRVWGQRGSCRGPGLGSIQSPHGSSQSHVIPVLGDLLPSCGLASSCMHVVHIHWHRHTCTEKSIRRTYSLFYYFWL